MAQLYGIQGCPSLLFWMGEALHIRSLDHGCNIPRKSSSCRNIFQSFFTLEKKKKPILKVSIKSQVDSLGDSLFSFVFIAVNWAPTVD